MNWGKLPDGPCSIGEQLHMAQQHLFRSGEDSSAQIVGPKVPAAIVGFPMI